MIEDDKKLCNRVCFGFFSSATINRMVKDVVCFHAEDFEKVVEKLKIDLYEPPASQVRHNQENTLLDSREHLLVFAMV